MVSLNYALNTVLFTVHFDLIYNVLFVFYSNSRQKTKSLQMQIISSSNEQANVTIVKSQDVVIILRIIHWPVVRCSSLGLSFGADVYFLWGEETSQPKGEVRSIILILSWFCVTFEGMIVSHLGAWGVIFPPIWSCWPDLCKLAVKHITTRPPNLTHHL